MFVPAMIQHVLGEHTDVKAPGPPTKQDAPEMHPDMVVDDPVRGAGIPTEGAVGVIHLDGCLISIDGVGLFSGDPGHGGGVDNPVQPNVLFLPVQRVVAVHGIPVTVHQTPDRQCGLVPFMAGHSHHHREHGFHQFLCLLQMLGFLLSSFSIAFMSRSLSRIFRSLPFFRPMYRPWSVRLPVSGMHRVISFIDRVQTVRVKHLMIGNNGGKVPEHAGSPGDESGPFPKLFVSEGLPGICPSADFFSFFFFFFFWAFWSFGFFFFSALVMPKVPGSAQHLPDFLEHHSLCPLYVCLSSSSFSWEAQRLLRPPLCWVLHHHHLLGRDTFHGCSSVQTGNTGLAWGTCWLGQSTSFAFDLRGAEPETSPTANPGACVGSPGRENPTSSHS